MSRTYGKAQDLIDFTRASSGTALRRVKYTEKVVNGTFDSDLSGWTDQSESGGSIAWSASGIALTTGVDGTQEGKAYQVVTTQIGKVYRITATRSGAASRFDVSASSSLAADIYFSPTNTSDIDFVFVATSSTTYLNLRNLTAYNDTAYIDNVSVKEVTFDTSDGDLILFNHPNNVPRIEYDANGNVLGLLVEESRTNLITYSDLSALWSLSNCTKTVNYATSPDGQSNATLFQATSNAQSYLIQSISKAASQIHYSLSVYVKKTNSKYVSLRIQGIYPSRADVIFDLDTGSISAGPAIVLNFSNATASITSAGNDWYRISLSALSDTGTLITSVIAFSQNAIVVDGTETASDSSGLMHNIQLEAGSFPTSAIPTSGSTATRSADVASLSTSAFGYRQDAGTVVVDLRYNGVGTSPRILCFSDGTNTNRIVLDRIPVVTVVNNNSVTVSDAPTSSSSVLTPYKVGLSLSDSNTSITIDGETPSTSSGTIPKVISKLIIGDGQTSPRYINGHIKSLRYYPRALTNAQLQELTS